MEVSSQNWKSAKENKRPVHTTEKLEINTQVQQQHSIFSLLLFPQICDSSPLPPSLGVWGGSRWWNSGTLPCWHSGRAGEIHADTRASMLARLSSTVRPYYFTSVAPWQTIVATGNHYPLPPSPLQAYSSDGLVNISSAAIPSHIGSSFCYGESLMSEALTIAYAIRGHGCFLPFNSPFPPLWNIPFCLLVGG